MMKKVFPILALAMFSATLGIGVVSPLLPLYARDMGATGIWLGIIVSAYAISNSIAVPITGKLSDRRGRKLFLVIGLLVNAIISLGYIYAGNVTHLTLVRLIQGLSGAATYPIAMAYLGDLSPEGEEGKWMGYATAAFFAGFGFGPLLGGVLTDYFGVSSTFFTMGGLNLMAFLVSLFFLPESSHRKISDESRPLSFKEMRSNGIIKGIFTFRLVQALGRGGIFAFLPIFAAMMGLSLSRIGVLITISFLSWILFAPLGGLIADRLNRRTLIIVGNFLFGVLLMAIPLTNNFGQLLAVLLIQGFNSALVMPAASALIVEEGRTYGMGSSMSVLFLAMGIGMAIGPIISGGLADWLNVDSVFYFGGVMGLIGTGLFASFTKGYRQ